MKDKLLEAIVLTFAYYNPSQVLSNQVVQMYAEDLSDLAADRCIVAYRTYRLNPKNSKFPLPAQIRQIVAPEESIPVEAEAREIAARICGAIPKFGWCNANAAREFVGPIGWQVIMNQGGWSYLCQNMGTRINPTTFQAQVRDQLAANIQFGAPAIEAKIFALQERKQSEPAPIAATLKQLLQSKNEHSNELTKTGEHT